MQLAFNQGKELRIVLIMLSLVLSLVKVRFHLIFQCLVAILPNFLTFILDHPPSSAHSPPTLQIARVLSVISI